LLYWTAQPYGGGEGLSRLSSVPELEELLPSLLSLKMKSFLYVELKTVSATKRSF